jgi:hypothetical protein
MIFAMEKMKNAVIKQADSHPELTFHRLVSQVFREMIDITDQAKRADTLRALAKELEKHSNVRFRDQHDLVEAMSLLMGALEEEGSQTFAMMQIKFKKCCSCPESFIFENAFLPTREHCSHCEMPMRLIILRGAPYLSLISTDPE